MRACWLKWVGRDWSISADYIWLNYSGANTAVPIGGHVHARLGLGRAVGLGYVEGRRGARGGVVPRGGEGDAVLGCRGGVGVGGL